MVLTAMRATCMAPSTALTMRMRPYTSASLLFLYDLAGSRQRAVFLAMRTMAWRPQHTQLQFACAHRFLASLQFLHTHAGSRRGRCYRPCARRAWRPARAATTRCWPPATAAASLLAPWRCCGACSARRPVRLVPPVSDRLQMPLLGSSVEKPLNHGQPAHALEVLRRMQREVLAASVCLSPVCCQCVSCSA